VRLADDNLSSDNSLSGGAGLWDNTNRLLRSIQDEYQVTRRQLEQVNRHLAAREVQIDRHLQRAAISSSVLQPLCLVEYSLSNPINQLGTTILGGSSRPLDWTVSPCLYIRCFGRFNVRSTSGQIEQWHSAKAKSVFQYLLIRPREPALRDMLMEALWPECSPKAAANNLKVAVHQLKSTLSSLGAEMENLRHVLFLQGSYLINPEMNLWIDAEEFEKHWTAGRRFEKGHNANEAIREYENAEALYQGDYLADELYEEWTLLRREALKDIYLIVLSKLAEHGIIVNDYESCIHYSQKMLAQDDCREDAYRWLMYCYTKLGQRNRALRWYEICCRIIRNELDITPDKKTNELYHRILNDEEN
jgi:LuxR family transcriptional regulator, maltose regulon positive regulatory protein